ncbi:MULTISPECIES: DUF3619 family protein [unclassified Roseateles]|uniref:DUF3619 family protein n=1 Tax=unclassified Roseateles TaxID=2626991 RepID=UPI000701D8DE|nr:MULTISPECIES: DUF3619 family protein [unclassified Roseateles]KQW44789.1 hypothetical protein ASC81_14555 [Pelomonas sp. Root405]KRA70148.1 hypothetical protein ASD88_18715 [Pelomonas sp. Root662]
MKSSNLPTPSAELDSRVTRFGLRVAASLTERSNALPHDVSERLRFAREQAVARASQARAAASATVSAAPNAVQMGSTLALNGGPRSPGNDGGLWTLLLSALPLLLLAAGLLLMQQGQVNEQIAAAAEVDTALLSDSLPPSAFTDPGFAEFLRDAEE